MEKRTEKLKAMQEQLRELDKTIQTIIDGESSMKQFAEKYGMVTQTLNRTLNNGLSTLLRKTKIANNDDILQLLKSSASPSERLVNQIFRTIYGDDIDLILLDIEEDEKVVKILDDVLNEVESKIIKYRFGFYDGERKTITETSNLLFVTRSRVSKIEAKALRKLRKPENLKNLLYNYKLRIKGLQEFETIITLEKELEYKEEIDNNCNTNKTIDLSIPIDDLGLSVRSYNALKMSGINTVNQILCYTAADLMRIRNLGCKSCREIIEVIKNKFGIEIKDLKYDIELIDNTDTLSDYKSIDLSTSIDNLGLSVRTCNILKRSRINTIKDLSYRTNKDLMNIRSLGHTSYNKIINALKNKFGIELKDVEYGEIDNLNISYKASIALKYVHIYSIDYLSKLTTSDLLNLIEERDLIIEIVCCLEKQYNIKLVDNINITSDEKANNDLIKALRKYVCDISFNENTSELFKNDYLNIAPISVLNLPSHIEEALNDSSITNINILVKVSQNLSQIVDLGYNDLFSINKYIIKRYGGPIDIQ